jgi:hypothetical protein
MMASMAIFYYDSEMQEKVNTISHLK